MKYRLNNMRAFWFALWTLSLMLIVLAFVYPLS
jgi:hypothetical protein